MRKDQFASNPPSRVKPLIVRPFIAIQFETQLKFHKDKSCFGARLVDEKEIKIAEFFGKRIEEILAAAVKEQGRINSILHCLYILKLTSTGTTCDRFSDTEKKNIRVSPLFKDKKIRMVIIRQCNIKLQRALSDEEILRP